MSKSPNPKIFLALAGGSFVIGGLMVYMQWNNVSTQQERVAAVQKQVDDAAGVRVALETSEQRLSELKVQLAHLEKGIADYQYVPTMLKELEEFGNANGIQVLGVRPVIKPASAAPSTSEARKAYDELIIDVRGRGRYNDTLRFLTALHKFPKVVAARTVSLTPKTAGNLPNMGSPELDVQVELRVFVFPQVKADSTPASVPEATVATSSEGSNNG